MFGKEVKIKPCEILPHAKGLGAKIWSYILDLSELEAENFLNNGGIVTSQKYSAIKQLNSFSEEILRSRSANQVLENNDLRKYAQALNKDGEHIFNYLKRVAAGKNIEHKEYDDTVLSAFSKICIESFPAFLLPRSRLDLNLDTPIFFDKSFNIDFEKAIINDPEISQIFPDINNKFNSSYQIYTSVGHGSSVQICNFYQLLLHKAYILMRLKNKLSIDELIQSAGEILKIIRASVRGDAVQVPIVVCFEGANLKSNSQIVAFNGVIESLHSGIKDAIPLQALPSSLHDEGKGFVFRTFVDYKITMLPANVIASKDSWPSPLLDYDLLERISNAISFALVMSSEEEKTPISAINVSTLIIDPFSFGPNVSWRGVPYNSPVAVDVSESNLGRFQGWLKLLEGNEDKKIFIAKKRLLSALVDRLNPEDGFIDLIFALENLFGQRFEVSLGIATCVSKILSSDYDERQKIFSNIKNLYNQRSNIVHGRGDHLSNEKMVKLRDEALKYVMASLKWVYQESPDLLNIESSERVKRIVLN